MRRHETDAGLADFDKTLRLDPNYASAYLNRGLMHLNKNEYALAIYDFDETLRRDPNNYMAFVNRSQARKGTKDWGEALSDIDAAVHLQPASPWAYLNRGVLYEHFKYFRKAQSDYDTAIRLDPTGETGGLAHNNKGLMWRRQNQFELSILSFNEAIRLLPRFAEAYFERSIAFGRKGDTSSAYSDLQRAVAIKPSLREHPRFQLAQGLAAGTIAGINAPEIEP